MKSDLKMILCWAKKGEGTFTEADRGTGRTTAMVLQALSRAILARGADVEVFDHIDLTCRTAERMARMVRGSANALCLLVDVRRTGRRLFVRSALCDNRHAVEARACKDRAIGVD